MHAHTRFQRGPGEGCVAEPLANGECEGALLHLASDSHNIKCRKKDRGGANGICNVTSPCARPRVIFSLNLNAAHGAQCTTAATLSVSNNHCSESELTK